MKILSLTLEAAELPPLYEFYAGDLGLPVRRRTADSLALQIGETVLTFQRGQTSTYHFAFNVHPARFERTRAALAAITPLLHDADGQEIFEFRSWDARACYCYDSVGNVVELIARRDLAAAAAPPDPAVLGVGEIGLVTDDVPALTARLQRQIGLPIYRDSAGDAFAALGDVNGLLILVRRGRIWYPETGKAAVVAPLTCHIQTSDSVWILAGPPYQVTRA